MLAETALQPIRAIASFESRIQSLEEQARVAATKVIRPNQTIQDLLNSNALAQWVREGRHLHIDRATCAFCRSPLPEDLWSTLDKHFNEESEELQRTLTSLKTEAETERARMAALTVPARNHVYSAFHTRHDELTHQLSLAKERYATALDDVSEVLRLRSESIFVPQEVAHRSYSCATEVAEALSGIAELVAASNAHTAQLDSSQKALREELRLSEVAVFVIDSDYDTIQAELNTEEKAEKEILAEMQKLKLQGDELNAKLEGLKNLLRDERRGADQVNRFLGHSLGGTNLRLIAQEQEGLATYRFRIMRGEQPAYNLSEGECSLVSFCYFLARLDDVTTQSTSPIIYIDDPISSLDSNHIFFIFSLIDRVIARPLLDEQGNFLKGADGKKVYRYEQLFISTHNLEFLNYLKKLSKPSEKSVEHFLIVRKSASSCIGLMPPYLRNYLTELNYLFGEVHTCAHEANAAKQHHSFYNFGSNLRKFLEAFLFFRYPSSALNEDARLRLFFSGTEGAAEFLQRITNEHSHLKEYVDRGALPIDSAEITRTSLFVLKTMRERDPVQYGHFLESISAVDPLATA
ncbi:AAA family ATPase [Hydrogenophaga sp.]|uniref:AAA family ATPase n=1 Tax=Hydrogenophaga sp. TaxID=1904254 RepID=UPI00351CD82E